jgi:predicted secreted protein
MDVRVYLACILSMATYSLAAIYKEPITTREGFIFTVRIPSTQTAGIDWFWGNGKELKDYVKLVKSEFMSSSSLNNGHVGKKIFTFKALKKGKVTLKLIKRKSWENQELDHKLIKVIIKDADYTILT